MSLEELLEENSVDIKEFKAFFEENYTKDRLVWMISKLSLTGSGEIKESRDEWEGDEQESVYSFGYCKKFECWNPTGEECNLDKSDKK